MDEEMTYAMAYSYSQLYLICIFSEDSAGLPQSSLSFRMKELKYLLSVISCVQG